MIGSAQKFITGALVLLILFAVSDSVIAMQTDAVQFNATLGFGEYGFDSGYIGLDEALARMQVRAYGTLGLNLADVTMNGIAWTDSGVIGVTGTSNGGNFSFSLGLEYGAYAYYGIPVLGLDYELDLLTLLGTSSLELLLNDSQAFTPFLLDNSIQISDALPAENVLNLDLTEILFPGIPFAGAGITLDADMGLEETLSGESIYFSNPGNSIYSESSTLPFASSSTVLSYYENADAEVIVGFWPGLYAEAFGYRFDFTPVRIPFTVYSSDLPLPFNNSAVNFSGSITSLNVSASVSPSSNVPPYSSVNVSGTVTYNTGESVQVGTVTIDTGYDVYSAAVSNGSFDRDVHVGSSDGYIYINAECEKPDGSGDLYGSTQVWVDIYGTGSSGYYDYWGHSVCTGIGGDYWPTGETTYIRSDYGQVYVWVRLTDLFLNNHNGSYIAVRWEWYGPGDSDGSPSWTYETEPGDRVWDPGSGSYYPEAMFWCYYNVAGTVTADREGLWRVKISVYDGVSWVFRDTAEFTIRYDFTEHKTCKGVTGSPNFEPDQPTDVFTQTDSDVYTWMNLDNLAEDLDVKWEWYEPAGSLYDTFLAEPISQYDQSPGGFQPPFDWYRIWGNTGINGYPAANKCGKWEVRVYLKDPFDNYDHEYTDYFQILENPPVNPNVSVSANPSSPIETQPVTLNLSATDNTYLDTVELHWKVNGVEQTPEISSNINTGQKNISRNIGSFSSGQQIEYWGVAIDTSGNRAESPHTTIVVLSEIVTTPDRPSGEVYLKAGQSGTYTTGGSSTTLSHAVQYEFDWGDSTLSGFGSATQVKSWPSDGHYFVKAHAQCQIHTSRESSWSTPIIVNVDSTSPIVDIVTNGGEDFGTSLAQVVITGTVNDVEPTSGLATVSINTGATNEGTLFDWQFTINLSEGDNPLTITAEDNAGNIGQDTIVVKYDAVPKTIYVDANSPNEPGSGIPEDPYRRIQDGIDAAYNGDTVIVAEGIYYENINFGGKNIILTGTDPNDPNIIANTTIDGNDISSVVIFAGTEDPNCLLTGFTVTHGDSVDYGGGIYGAASRATISKCTVVDNSADDGGGIYDCDGLITHCNINNNTAGERGGGLIGCNGDIIDCIISDNTSAGAGGGLYNCDANIVNCVIANNTNTGYMGEHGGGLCNCDGQIVNCTVVGNKALYDAGGGYGGGLYDCNAVISNCIIWENVADVEGNQLYSCPDPNYSCIQDWTGGGIGNIVDEPCFADPNHGNYHLLSGSPCVDAADNNAVPPSITTDLDDKPRFVDDLLTDNTGNGTPPIVDMGAYEYQGLYADLNGNGIVNFKDFAIFASYWLDETCLEPDWCAGADMDQDGIVCSFELAIFAGEWLKVIPVKFYNFSLDTNPGWSTEGEWAFGQPLGGGGSHGNPDPNSGYTGCNVYGVNLNGDYTIAVGGPYHLTAGPFDCNDYHSVHVKFARWLNTDMPNYVASKIEASNNGSVWSVVWEHTGSSEITDDSWQITEYDISNIAGDQDTVYLRWSYQILSAQAYSYCGWNIDDIELWGVP